MIISTDSNTINRESYKKWVDFQADENCVAWFGKGFVSYNKGYLFTDRRLLEFEKKKSIHDVQLADVIEVLLHVKERLRNEAMNLDNVKGELVLKFKDRLSIEIKIDEKNEEVQKAISAIAPIINVEISVSGDPSFILESSSSAAGLVEMQQDGFYVNIVLNKKTFSRTTTDVKHDQGFIMDKTHYTQTFSEPIFKFLPVCAWSGQPAESKTKLYSFETEEYNMLDINPMLNLGKTLASFILTAGKRVDNLVKFVFQFDLPVADNYEGDESPQVKFIFNGAKAVLSIKFPSEEMAAEFVQINSEIEDKQS